MNNNFHSNTYIWLPVNSESFDILRFHLMFDIFRARCAIHTYNMRALIQLSCVCFIHDAWNCLPEVGFYFNFFKCIIHVPRSNNEQNERTNEQQKKSERVQKGLNILKQSNSLLLLSFDVHYYFFLRFFFCK